MFATSGASPCAEGGEWPPHVLPGAGESPVCAGALSLSLCQFLCDSCRHRDHTSITCPAGEGDLDKGHHIEIKEVIHPFTPTEAERAVRTDCGFGLRAEEVGLGGEGERKAEAGGAKG